MSETCLQMCEIRRTVWHLHGDTSVKHLLEYATKSFLKSSANCHWGFTGGQLLSHIVFGLDS